MNNETTTSALMTFIYRLEIIALPTLIIFGTVCNIITFLVMRRRRMRVSSTCFYMAALAVTDTLVLWTGCLNQWFYIIHIPTVVAKSNFTCKLLPFLFVFFADASVWIIVCMSFERYVAVSRPLSASRKCTIKRAKWVLLAMCIVFAFIDGHFLLTLELEIIDGHYRVCHPKPWARYFVEQVFVFIDALKYSAIPFFIILILSILIIRRVFHAEDISAQLQNLRPLHNYRQYSTTSSPNSTRNSSTLGINNMLHTNLLSSSTRVGRRVTLMLLSVSIAFCVFSAPMSLMQIVQSIVKPGHHETPLAIGKAIAELCQYINHSCNFFLYALAGRIFRREIVRLCFPTRLGSRRDTGAGTGINGVRLSVRGGLVPQGIHSSSRHGSLYSIDVNRQNRCLPVAARRMGKFYPVQYNEGRNELSNRSSPRRSPYVSSNDIHLIAGRFNYLNNEKSSMETMINHNNNHNHNNMSIINFWNKLSKTKDANKGRVNSLLFVDGIKFEKRAPRTV